MKTTVFLASLILLLFFSVGSLWGQVIPFGCWKTQTTNGWAWIGGYSTQEQSGHYGTQAVGSTLNYPGVRLSAMAWSDGAGNLWIFGGVGFDDGDYFTGGSGELSDLWKYEISTGKWTWVSGPTVINQGGVYGTKGVASTTNYPGARHKGTTWIDGSGNLWLFGGWGADEASHGSFGYLNDLWKFNPATSQWTWVSGDKWSDQSPTYGTKGTANASNVPGARDNSVKFSGVDASGNLWLFGGEGYDSTSAFGNLNDLWKFNPSTSQWTWMSGTNLKDQNPTYGTKGTGSTSNIPGGRVSPMQWVDSSGFVWIMAGHGRDKTGTVDYLNDLWKYEIATGKWTWVTGSDTVDVTGTYGTKGAGSTSNVPGSRSNSINALDASGNLWIFAGSAYDSNGVLGLTNDVWKFTPSNSQWAWIAGSNQAEHLDPQAGVYGTKGVGSTANSPGPRHVPVMWYDNSSGKLWMHGGWGYTKSTSPVTSYLGDLWSLDPSNLNWTWVNGPSDIGWDNTTGTLGVASATNFPGARYGAVTLRDGSGNLWLFGGYGVSPQGGLGDMSDLWKYNPTTSQWTWMSGPDYPDQAGVYGTKGTGSTNNYPGGRKFSIGWIDGSGIIWLFGGAGNDYVPNYGDLNDLWKFNPSNSQWTWVAGAKTVSVKGTYGTKGTGSTGNIPGGREKATAWIDSSGNFWLFGGYGWDGAATAVQGYLSDLWEFAPGTSQWTWVSGSKNANSYPTWGTKGVANTANIPGSRSDATSAVDSSGNFWIYSGYGLYSAGVDSNFGDLWKYDPAGGTWTWVSGFNTNSQNGTYGTKGVASTANVPGTRNVPRMVMDSSGKLWMFGGWGLDSAGSDGYLNDLWKYDPAGNTWTWMTGSNVIAQPGVYGNMGAASANNSPGARQYDNVWIDSSNNIWMYGGHGFDSTSTRGLLYDLWKYKP